MTGWYFEQLDAQKAAHRTTPSPNGTTPDISDAYIEAAAKAEMATVANAPEGTRNDTLNRAAFNLATLIHTGRITETVIIDGLIYAADTAGLPSDEALRTIRSGIIGGLQHPRTIPERTTAHTAPPTTPQREPTKLLTRSELANLPEPEPLIHNTLDRRTVALLAGYWGTLKSFIALDWALSVANGHNWQGRETLTGPIIYVAAEGAYGIHKRIEAWEYSWGKQQQTPDELFRVYPAPLNLLHPAEVGQLCEYAVGALLVIIDTVNRCAVGGDENSARDMGMFIDALYRIREATGDGTALALHHTGKDKTTIRGSSALEAGVDTIYQTEGDHTGITLKRTKRKDGPPIDTHELRFEPVQDSGIIVPNRRGTNPNENTMLSHFESHFGETGATANQLRETMPDISRSTFYRSLNALITGGQVQNVGTDKRPFYRLTGETPSSAVPQSH